MSFVPSTHDTLTICVPCMGPCSDYSHQNDARQQRSFFVKCIGEGVDDNGGPYRAVVGAATGEEPAGPLEMLVGFWFMAHCSWLMAHGSWVIGSSPTAVVVGM